MQLKKQKKLFFKPQRKCRHILKPDCQRGNFSEIKKLALVCLSIERHPLIKPKNKCVKLPNAQFEVFGGCKVVLKRPYSLYWGKCENEDGGESRQSMSPYSFSESFQSPSDFFSDGGFSLTGTIAVVCNAPLVPFPPPPFCCIYLFIYFQKTFLHLCQCLRNQLLYIYYK